MKKIFKSAALLLCGAFIAVSFSSCKSDNNGGDNNGGSTVVDPSTIAAANLVAYFPLESATESIDIGDGISFDKMAGAASFVTGRRGDCYKGSSDEAYLQYSLASTNPFKTMTEFTIAAWVKTAAAGATAMIFQVNGGDGTMGNLDLTLEGNSNADSLQFKGYLYNSTTTWQGQDITSQNIGFTPNKWVHVVFSYNKTTSTMSLYANGILVQSAEKYADPNSTPLGALTFKDDMTKINIGAWDQQINDSGTQTWMTYFPGLLDEVRVYNKALSNDEVKELYDAEVDNINI